MRRDRADRPQPQPKPLPAGVAQPPPVDEPVLRKLENFCCTFTEPQDGHSFWSSLMKPMQKTSKSLPHARQLKS